MGHGCKKICGVLLFLSGASFIAGAMGMLGNAPLFGLVYGAGALGALGNGVLAGGVLLLLYSICKLAHCFGMCGSCK